MLNPLLFAPGVPMFVLLLGVAHARLHHERAGYGRKTLPSTVADEPGKILIQPSSG